MTLWQIWLATGLLLLFLEMATPGFVLFFFGVAALLMSIVTFFVPNLDPFVQVLLFSLLSVAGILFLRKALRNTFSGKKIGKDNVMASDFIGKSARVVERVTPQASGKVEFNGSHWRAVSNATLELGATVTVTAQENLTLTVEPKD